MEHKKSKLTLKGIDESTGIPFIKEIHSLDEVKTSGTYIVIARNATSEENGFPKIHSKADSCFCCEANLVVNCCYNDDESQSTNTYGQELTISDKENNSTGTYKRTVGPAGCSEWLMVATGDIKLIAQNNDIVKAYNEVSANLNAALERIDKAEDTVSKSHNTVLESATVRFDRIEENEATINAGEIGSTPSAIVYYKPANKFVAADSSGAYWDTWSNMEAYMSGSSIRKDKLYLCGEMSYICNSNMILIPNPKKHIIKGIALNSQDLNLKKGDIMINLGDSYFDSPIRKKLSDSTEIYETAFFNIGDELIYKEERYLWGTDGPLHSAGNLSHDRKRTSKISTYNYSVNGSTGNLNDSINKARLATELLLVNGLKIILKDGFRCYFYIYDIEKKYITYNESLTRKIIHFKYPCTLYVRLVFLHNDKVSEISSIEDAVESIDGIYESLGDIVDNISDLDKKIESIKSLTIPECKDYPVWQPEYTTSEYETENDRNAIQCSLSYFDFLATYFDKWVGKSDIYTISKRSLGLNTTKEYEIYEYDFCPTNYNRTIMLSAGMNACELPAIFGLAYFLDALLTNTKEEGLAYIRNNVRIKIIPIICPYAFSQEFLMYGNANGVNINRNFQYRNNWNKITSASDEWNYKGETPESEVETKILKRWMMDNSTESELWIDCHTDVGNTSGQTFYTMISDAQGLNIIKEEQTKIKTFLENLGYSPTAPSVWIPSGTDYPKIPLAWNDNGMRCMMIEQMSSDAGHGGNGKVNSDADIKNYVCMLRSYILALLKREELNMTEEELNLLVYRLNRSNIGKTERMVPVSPYFGLGGLNTADAQPNTNEYRRHTNYIAVNTNDSVVITLNNYIIVEVYMIKSDKTVKNVVSPANNTFSFEVASDVKFFRFSFRNIDNSSMRETIPNKTDINISINGII